MFTLDTKTLEIYALLMVYIFHELFEELAYILYQLSHY